MITREKFGAGKPITSESDVANVDGAVRARRIRNGIEKWKNRCVSLNTRLSKPQKLSAIMLPIVPAEEDHGDHYPNPCVRVIVMKSRL